MKTKRHFYLFIALITLGQASQACMPPPAAPKPLVILPSPTRLLLEPTLAPPTPLVETPVFFVELPLVTSTLPSTSGPNLVRNADFSQGLEFWDVQPSERCAHCTMKAKSGDSRYPYILAWQRSQSGNDGAALWAHQPLNADLRACDRLILTFALRVEAQTLLNSGWWSDQNNGSGEYPLKISLNFISANGASFEWSHGFLAAHDGATHLTNYTLAPLGRWSAYEANLLSPQQWLSAAGQPLPAPATLTAIYVGGNGWDFAGAVANIRLSGCQAR